MKLHTAIAITTALMARSWQPAAIAESWMPGGSSYPLTNNRRTGKAAERRKAKQRRRARL